MNGDSQLAKSGEMAFVLRLDSGFGFIFMGLAGILNEVVLRLEIMCSGGGRGAAWGDAGHAVVRHVAFSSGAMRA